MSSTVYTVHIDGASRGNPGPAAWAYSIRSADGQTTEAGGSLGTATNNVAEYTALLQALDQLYQMGARQAIIHSDSELLVKQINGQYQVKNVELKQLYDQAKQKCQRLESVQVRHVRREQNRRADQLCNQTLDGLASKSARADTVANPPGTSESNLPGTSKSNTSGKSKSAAKSPSKKKAKKPLQRDDLTADALACLRAAANAWALGNPNDPPPEAVWEQLLSILTEGRSDTVRA